MIEANRSSQKGNAVSGPYIYILHPGHYQVLFDIKGACIHCAEQQSHIRTWPLPLLTQATDFLTNSLSLY
jgi:hypothetical protein